MAKLQIFVLVLAIAQGYCEVAVNLPFILSPQEVANIPGIAAIPDIPPIALPNPAPVPEISDAPPCVAYIVQILQAVIEKLQSGSDIDNRPLPVDPDDFPLNPNNPGESEEVEDVPVEDDLPVDDDDLPEVSPLEPCVQCFEHISNLVEAAEYLASLKLLGEQASFITF